MLTTSSTTKTISGTTTEAAAGSKAGGIGLHNVQDRTLSVVFFASLRD